jgi:N-acylneuraminate cytidylyltransferase
LKNIAIIPARGGSKRIPRKNIKNFLGMPIIAYSIKTAIESSIFDEVMVSTDDEEIAEVALKYGASVPFLRSEKNSNDYASTIDVIFEVLNHYKNKEIAFEIGACIYATAPLITAQKLITSLDHLIEQNLDSVFPIQKFSFPIQRALKFTEGKINFINQEFAKARSQDLEVTYHDSGQFYFFKINRLFETKSLLTSNTSCIIIDEHEAQDIDNETDWKLAELKYKMLHDVV